MKIVVRGTNWIGDAIMTIPALRELRRIFPAAHLALAAPGWAADLFEESDFLDEILPLRAGRSSLRNVLDQTRTLRRRKFDLAVLFTNSFSSAFVTALTRAGRSYGYRNEGRAFLFTNPVRMPEWKNRRHEAHYYLNLVSRIENDLLGTDTVTVADPVFDLMVSDQKRTAARQFLDERGIRDGEPYVAMGPGSTNSDAKRWPAGKFARLNDKIRREFGFGVVLLGTENEMEVCESVTDVSKFPPVNLCGATSLSMAVGILAEARLLISNDMGLAHISAAIGNRTVTIFGPTNPETTAPRNSMVVREDVECAPCMLRKCPIDHRCMTRISSSSVLRRIGPLLAE